MPWTINGIGTCYYGKKRIHTVRSECEFCGSYEQLSSYDVTNYFVVLFLPLVPLGNVRIIKECPRCKKHRVMPLKEWERAKSEAVADVMAQIERDVDDRDGVKRAIGIAIAFQDLPFLEQVAEHLARPMTDDFEVQSMLGIAFAYFSRPAEAEAAFRTALAVRSDDETSRMLSVEILRQGRPRDAEPFVRHIVDQKNPNHVGNLFLLIEGYQAQGDHIQAMEWVKRCEQLFPQLKTDPEFQAIQKSAEKYARAGRPVPSKSLPDLKKVGYQEKNFDATFAKWIGPLIAAVALILFFNSAIHHGRHREVQLVSGLHHAYAVSINGRRYDVPPLSRIRIEVAEGDLELVSADEKFPLERHQLRIETPFWTRPFARRTFVLNPDQTALVAWQETVYGANSVTLPAGDFQLHTNSLLHDFSGVDYPFQPFPDTIRVKGNITVRKTGLDVLEGKYYEPRSLLILLRQQLSPEQTLAYVAQRLRFEPNDDYLVSFLASQMKPQPFIELARPRLAARPLLVMWHRAYQDAMQRLDPKFDLESEYKQLLDADPANPDLSYLLSRVTSDLDVAEQRLLQATKTDPPSLYGLFGLSFSKLTRGEFAEAEQLGMAALRIQPNAIFRHSMQDIWLANGKFDEVEAANRVDPLNSTSPYLAGIAEVTLLVQRGEFEKAHERCARYQQERLAPEVPPAQRSGVMAEVALLKAIVEYGRGELAEYERQMVSAFPGSKSFVVSFSAERWDEAAEALAAVDDEESRWPMHLLLYVANHRANRVAEADKQLQLAVQILQAGDAERRQLASALGPAGQSNTRQFLRLPFQPDQKRIILAALGSRFPVDRAAYFDLGRRMNFDRRPPYWFLKKVFEE